ncbi:MAG TPA: hypothetical protein VJS64_16120, partial [Pyrinomonadaceae bacterium]|nr:hypothetical protein [Pyrinomonadaceae bacterium]
KYKCGCIFAHQFLEQATSSLRASLAANTTIKMAGGVSTSDARALASDMRTTPDFILSQRRLHFACHIRNITPNAVSIPVPVGELENQPTLTEDAYEHLRELNRRRVSLPQPIRGEGFIFTNAPPPVPGAKPMPRDDPSAASEEW